MVQSLIDTVSSFEWSLTYLFYSSPTSPPASRPMQKYPPRSTWLRPLLCHRKKPELLERRQLKARLSCDVQLLILTGRTTRRNPRAISSIQSFVVSASALTQMLSLLKLRTCLPSSSTLLKSDHHNSSRRASLLSKTMHKMPPLEIAKDLQELRTCSSSSIAESKSPLTLKADASLKLTLTLSPLPRMRSTQSTPDLTLKTSTLLSDFLPS